MTAAKRSRSRSSVTDLQKRQGEAADLLAAGFASAEATSQLAAKHQVSRRTAQRWVLEGLKDLSLAGHGNNAVDSSELAQLRLLALRLYRKSVDAGNFILEFPSVPNASANGIVS